MKSPIGVWSDTVGIDWLIAGALAGGDLAFAQWSGHGDLLGSMSADARRTLYFTLAGSTGVIAGSGMAALAFYYRGEPGRRLRIVEKRAGDILRKTWIGCVGAPLLCALVFAIAIAIDAPTNDPPLGVAPATPFRWVVIAALVLAVARLGRLVWAFREVLPLSTADAGDSTAGVAERQRATG